MLFQNDGLASFILSPRDPLPPHSSPRAPSEQKRFAEVQSSSVRRWLTLKQFI